jgi:hypothetical protein
VKFGHFLLRADRRIAGRHIDAPAKMGNALRHCPERFERRLFKVGKGIEVMNMSVPSWRIRNKQPCRANSLERFQINWAMWLFWLLSFRPIRRRDIHVVIWDSDPHW